MFLKSLHNSEEEPSLGLVLMKTFTPVSLTCCRHWMPRPACPPAGGSHVQPAGTTSQRCPRPACLLLGSQERGRGLGGPSTLSLQAPNHVSSSLYAWPNSADKRQQHGPLRAWGYPWSPFLDWTQMVDELPHLLHLGMRRCGAEGDSYT